MGGTGEGEHRRGGTVCLRCGGWVKKVLEDGQSKRVFEGGIRNQSCAMLLLDFMYAENDKNRNAQSIICCA